MLLGTTHRRIRYNANQVVSSHINETNFVVKTLDESQDRKPETESEHTGLASVCGLPSFEQLIGQGMASDGLPGHLYCATPTCPLLKDWVPIFSLQAIFLLEDKALVVGFSFQHSLVDGTAINTVLESFVKNLKHDPDYKKGQMSGKFPRDNHMHQITNL